MGPVKFCVRCGAAYDSNANPPRNCTRTDKGVRCDGEVHPRETHCLVCMDKGTVEIQGEQTRCPRRCKPPNGETHAPARA